MSREDVEKFLPEWQRLLRLADWRIALEWMDGRESDREAKEGDVQIVHTYRQAVIRLCDPSHQSCARTYDHFPYDAEQVMVHELIECYFDPFKAEKGDPNYALQETAIEMLSLALVELKRKK